MRKIQIPKGGGRFRLIYMPNFREKRALRAMLKDLERICRKIVPPGVVHGFMPGRSPVTNALFHAGFKFTVSMDLQDFFDSVTPEMMPADVTEFLPGWERLFVDGAARQGLPTSPLVANIAAGCRFDWKLEMACRQRNVRYTRYADDLTFSFNDEALIAWVLGECRAVVEAAGFKINRRKTRVQSAARGRRMITGVAVDTDRHAPRRIKRRLRAALHQGKASVAEGLAEWAKMRLPKGFNEEEKLGREKLEADWFQE